MANDILCPSCQHSLAFHKFDYGSCEAPLGGLTSKNMCGCPVTVHTYIQSIEPKEENIKKYWQLEKKYSQLELDYQICMDEVAKGNEILQSEQKKIEFLELKLKAIKELIGRAKSLEIVSPGSWFGLGYRNEVIKIINEIISELEKDVDNG